MTELKLYDHQETAIAYLRIYDGFALFMEQGTGKTIPALVRVAELLKDGDINDALVVAPKSAMGSWERDVEKFSGIERKLLEERLTIINYDKVWREQKGINKFDKEWGCIILDESHTIKNRTSKRSDFLLKLATKAEYKYILTGTPIGNGQLENIWSQFCFIDPSVNKRGTPVSNIFGGTYYDFQRRYCLLNKFHQPYRYINVDELQETIDEYSYRVTKAECLDLPDKLPDEIVKVELPAKLKKVYKQMAETSVVMEYDILAENPLSRMAKLRQLASGFVTSNIFGLEEAETYEFQNEKIQYLDELIDSMDKKLVIFAEFKHSIKEITKLLTKKKIKHVVLDGDQKNKKIWRDFQSDESITIIVVQYQSGNAGIDLFASDTIIYFEPTLRSTVLEQSRDRIHRSGQTQKCSYIHLLTKGTIEVDIYRALADYSDFSEKLFTEKMLEYSKGFDYNG